jgi:hypothetical protein
MSTTKTVFSKRRPKLWSQSGQLVLEYVLLLLVAVSIGSLLVSQLISRDPDNLSPASLPRAWHQMLEFISKDDPGS